MKKLLILSIFLLVVAVSFIFIEWQDIKDAEKAVIQQTEQRRLEREKRWGPKPYFLQVGGRIDTKEEYDTLFHYLSNFTRSELLGVKEGIENNVWLRSLIDSVIRINYGS